MTRNEEITRFLYDLKEGKRILKIEEDGFGVNHFINEVITVGLIKDNDDAFYELSRAGILFTNAGKSYDDFLGEQGSFAPGDKMNSHINTNYRMNPRARTDLINRIALHLQKLYTLSQLNRYLDGYGFEYERAKTVDSKRIYVEEILSTRANNEIIFAIAQDLGLDVPETTEAKPVNNTPVKTAPPNPTKKVFISHSSKDVDLVERLIDLLRAIGINPKNVFCTSIEGYGPKLGDNFLERIKRELNNDVIVLFVLSPNFFESPICMCEMGAAWVTTKEHVPILISPFTFNEIKGVLPHSQGMLITDKLRLNSLKEDLEKFFDLGPLRHSIWERERNNILDGIEQRLAARIQSSVS